MDDMVVRVPLQPSPVSTTISGVRTQAPERATSRTREAELVQAIIETLSDPHVLLSAVRDGEGAIVDFVTTAVNDPAAVELNGTVSGLLGLRLGEFFPTRYAQQLRDAFRDVVETGRPYVVDEWRHVSARSGRTYWLDVRATRLGDGVTATWRDVSDRHRVAEEIAASERRFRLLAENSSDVVLRTRGLRILWVSPSLTRTLGWTADEWVGRSLLEFLHADDTAAMATSAGHGTWHARFVLRCRLCDAGGTYHGPTSRAARSSQRTDGPTVGCRRSGWWTTPSVRRSS